jgi:hypothetical protein
MSIASAHLISYALHMPNGGYTYHNEATKQTPTAWLMSARKRAPNVVLIQSMPMTDKDVAIARQEGWVVSAAEEKLAA